MWTSNFWKALAERAIKSAAQGVVALIIADGATTNAFQFDWENAVGVALLMAALSALTSIASNGATNDSGPSLTNAEVLAPEPLRAK